MIERIEDVRALVTDFASWRLEVTDATRWLDKILPGRIVGAAKAQEGIALGVLAAHARMDAMRDEMNGLLHDQGLRASEWQRALGFDDLARSRADLDRANALALAGLAGKHRGRRAVIVGNGPSLQISDLPLLANDVTFGSNKIFLAFDEVDWRPDYYSVEDALVLQDNTAAISALHGPTKIFPANMRDHGYHGADTIFVPRIMPASWTNPLSDPVFPGFSDDMPDSAHGGSTVVYLQIQLAVFMGSNRIYLVGVDHNYSLPK